MTRLLLFFSKTDYQVYKNCTTYAKNIQLSLGLFVILTGLLAFISGSYAISNLFVEFDWRTNQIHFNEHGRYLTPILGFFYAIIIVAIDREIVSAKNKRAVLLRIPLAIVLGAVVAVPIELKMLEGRIEKQLQEDYKEENENVRMTKDNELVALENGRDSLKLEVNNVQQRVNYYENLMQLELAGQSTGRTTGKFGEGPVWRQNKALRDSASIRLERAKNDLQSFEKDEYLKRKKEIEQKYATDQVSQQFDLLSKYQALAKIEANDKTGSVRKMTWGITIIFMLFEIIPSLMKLITPATEYDALIEARRRLNIQLTNAAANEGLEDLDCDDLNAVFQEIDKRSEGSESKPLYYFDNIKKRMIRD